MKFFVNLVSVSVFFFTQLVFAGTHTTQSGIIYSADITQLLQSMSVVYPQDSEYIHNMMYETQGQKLEITHLDSNSFSIKGLPYQVKIISLSKLQFSYNGQLFELSQNLTFKKNIETIEKALKPASSAHLKYEILFGKKAHALGGALLALLIGLGVIVVSSAGCVVVEKLYSVMPESLKKEGNCVANSIFPASGIVRAIINDPNTSECKSKDEFVVNVDGKIQTIKKSELDKMGTIETSKGIKGFFSRVYEICTEALKLKQNEQKKYVGAKIRSYVDELTKQIPAETTKLAVPKPAVSGGSSK